MVINHPYLTLDACCFINLYVSGRLEEIVRTIPKPVAVTQTVWDNEVPTLRQIEHATRTRAEEAIEDSVIDIVDFDTSEAETFISYAAELGDDGEAATCAVAFHRSWAVATDDRAAIRFVQREAPHVQVVSTLELVAHWSEHTQVSPDHVREVLVQIRDVGRYVPGRGHSMWAWWDQLMDGCK